MSEDLRRSELGEVLAELAAQLDVPVSKYEDAKAHYDAVGDWLNRDESELAPYDPTIYPQGSFALGTAIHPIDAGDYDVDAVCLLRASKAQFSQQALKDIVGRRLRQHGTYAKMLVPPAGGRRCWTLKYADASKFHLDILPALPDEVDWLLANGVPHKRATHAICITDKATWGMRADWPRSNPLGYVDWFKERMRVVLEELRKARAFEKRAEVHRIQDFEVRTPLQRVIQLLKRHRDIAYAQDDDKPISILITTLAARAYSNEPDLLDALLAVIPRMRSGIEDRDGVLWVPNPVNPLENFADRWAECPRKAEIFFQWLASAEALYHQLLSQRGFRYMEDELSKSYGRAATSEALQKHAARRSAGVVVPTLLRPAVRTSSNPVQAKDPRFHVAHREVPPWPEKAKFEVTINAKVKQNGRWQWFDSGGPALPKGCDLMFCANTDAPSPFSVHWQVVNTGSEAAVSGGLRGRIFQANSAGRGGLVQREETSYRGMHWIECFVVHRGECVARSREFVVNIG